MSAAGADDWTSPASISPGDTSDAASSSLYTSQVGEPGYSSTYRTAWWTFTPSTSAWYHVQNVGTATVGLTTYEMNGSTATQVGSNLKQNWVWGAAGTEYRFKCAINNTTSTFQISLTEYATTDMFDWPASPLFAFDYPTIYTDAYEPFLVHLGSDKFLCVWHHTTYDANYAHEGLKGVVFQGGASPLRGSVFTVVSNYTGNEGWSWPAIYAVHLGNGYVAVTANTYDTAGDGHEHLALVYVDGMSGSVVDSTEETGSYSTWDSYPMLYEAGAGKAVWVTYLGGTTRARTVQESSGSLSLGTPTTLGSVGIGLYVNATEGTTLMNEAFFTHSGTTITANGTAADPRNSWYMVDGHAAHISGTTNQFFLSAAYGITSTPEIYAAKYQLSSGVLTQVETSAMSFNYANGYSASLNRFNPMTSTSGGVAVMAFAPHQRFVGLIYDVFGDTVTPQFLGMHPVTGDYAPLSYLGGQPDLTIKMGASGFFLVISDNFWATNGGAADYSKGIAAFWFPLGNIGQLHVNLSTDRDNPNWVSVCPEDGHLGHFNTAETGAPTWTQIHLGDFHANTELEGTPTWYTCCSHG